MNLSKFDCNKLTLSWRLSVVIFLFAGHFFPNFLCGLNSHQTEELQCSVVSVLHLNLIHLSSKGVQFDCVIFSTVRMSDLEVYEFKLLGLLQRNACSEFLFLSTNNLQLCSRNPSWVIRKSQICGSVDSVFDIYVNYIQ